MFLYHKNICCKIRKWKFDGRLFRGKYCHKTCERRGVVESLALALVRQPALPDAARVRYDMWRSRSCFPCHERYVHLVAAAANRCRVAEFVLVRFQFVIRMRWHPPFPLAPRTDHELYEEKRIAMTVPTNGRREGRSLLDARRRPQLNNPRHVQLASTWEQRCRSQSPLHRGPDRVAFDQNALDARRYLCWRCCVFRDCLPIRLQHRPHDDESRIYRDVVRHMCARCVGTVAPVLRPFLQSRRAVRFVQNRWHWKHVFRRIKTFHTDSGVRGGCARCGPILTACYVRVGAILKRVHADGRHDAGDSRHIAMVPRVVERFKGACPSEGHDLCRERIDRWARNRLAQTVATRASADFFGSLVQAAARALISRAVRCFMQQEAERRRRNPTKHGATASVASRFPPLKPPQERKPGLDVAATPSPAAPIAYDDARRCHECDAPTVVGSVSECRVGV
mgnify:CR=1 FL=1